jgi:Bacterial TniB protein
VVNGATRSDARADQTGATAVHEPLTSKEGWRRFIDATDDPPPPLSAAEAAAVTPLEQHGVGERRLGYHGRLAVVATPTVQQIALAGRRLMVLNRHQISARRGLIVTGGAGTGKTTAITQLGRAHELFQRLRAPDGGPRLPVVYVTVPPAATPRMLAVEFARFLGLPITTRSNITDVTNAVCGVLGACGCELVIVDEIHNLNLATRSGAEVSDQLKYFSERLPATFVYAGIDVERRGLFAGPRGSQIASRFATIATSPFPYGTQTQRQAWHALLATVEQTLRLRAPRPGTLVGLGGYLHQHAAGMIGSLSHLIRGAAIDAIITGEEKITKAGLDGVQLDHAAEHQHGAKTARTGRRTPRRPAGAA